MKRLSLLAILCFARAALAETPPAEGSPVSPEAKSAGALVQRELLQGLAAKERDQSKFSRARLPPQERRVRILDEQPRTDAHGDTFFAFAVDARHGLAPAAGDEGWRLGTVTGCVYLERSEIFVKSGDRHRPAAFLLGKNLKPVAEHICQPATAAAANTR